MIARWLFLCFNRNLAIWCFGYNHQHFASALGSSFWNNYSWHRVDIHELCCWTTKSVHQTVKSPRFASIVAYQEILNLTESKQTSYQFACLWINAYWKYMLLLLLKPALMQSKLTRHGYMHSILCWWMWENFFGCIAYASGEDQYWSWWCPCNCMSMHKWLDVWWSHIYKMRTPQD